MSAQTERSLISEIAKGLKGTFLDGQLILGGSSGLFVFPTSAPPFTEDIDYLVREDLVVSRGVEIVGLLERLGFRRAAETPTFTSPGRLSLDLVGYSLLDSTDHLSPAGPLQVMVFADLGIALGSPESVERHSDGTVALSPAGFCSLKLMTMRVEKGSKDKLQALLVIAERAPDSGFRGELARILKSFGMERRRDASADAQVALLSLQKDPTFKDHGAEGYSSFVASAEKGYQTLLEILKEASHGGT